MPVSFAWWIKSIVSGGAHPCFIYFSISISSAAALSVNFYYLWFLIGSMASKLDWIPILVTDGIGILFG